MDRDPKWFERNSDYPPSDREVRDPEEIPPPKLDDCSRVSTNVLYNGKVVPAEIVVIPKIFSDHNDDDDDTSSSNKKRDGYKKLRRAYWYQRKIREAIFGAVWYATLLIPSSSPEAEWEATSENCAVKQMNLEQSEDMTGQGSAENLLQEVALMQYMLEYHSKLQLQNETEKPYTSESPVEFVRSFHREVVNLHVMLPLDVLTDSKCVYLVMPYMAGGELFDILQDKDIFTENQARLYLCQILQAVKFLQQTGVCHRDISLENILADLEGNIVLFDFGISQKIPYEATKNDDSDRRKGDRCLMKPQGPAGKVRCHLY